MIPWEHPGYVVGFTTRAGGVSSGPFASLNLTASTGDLPEAVAENRRRACAALGLDPDGLALNRQVHGVVVRRAVAGGRGRPADGLWSDEPGQPLAALTADCVPIVLVAAGPRRAVAVLHAGWRGLAAGIVAEGVRALGGAGAAVVGPAIGACCYAVGSEVSRCFDGDLTRDGRLDLPQAAERALRRAGVARVERIEACTRCDGERFFSHRRDGLQRGAQGVIAAVA